MQAGEPVVGAKPPSPAAPPRQNIPILPVFSQAHAIFHDGIDGRHRHQGPGQNVDNANHLGIKRNFILRLGQKKQIYLKIPSWIFPTAFFP